MVKKSNLDILKSISSSEQKSNWKDQAKWRENNKDWLEHSFNIAVKILRTMRSKGISQKDLARIMEVTPQRINTILRGQENLGLETITRFQRALGIELIATTKPESNYVMKVSSGMAEFNYAIKGKKAEESYVSSIKHKPEMESLFVKANDFESVGALPVDCSQ